MKRRPQSFLIPLRLLVQADVRLIWFASAEGAWEAAWQAGGGYTQLDVAFPISYNDLTHRNPQYLQSSIQRQTSYGKEVRRLAMKGDQVTMKDGRVMVVRNGEMMLMEEEMTLSDGTRVMPNGQVLMADGTARMMREGETMTVDRKTTDDEEMTDRQFKEAMEDEELRDQM